MNQTMKQFALRLVAEVLSLRGKEEDRMQKLEQFDEAFGVSIPGWEAQMKEMIRQTGGPCVEEAVQSVDRFYAKYHVYDENGKLVYERKRVGSSHHQLVITFDANAPQGKTFTVKEIPEINALPLAELQEYYDDLQSALEDLTDDEPEEDSEAHQTWETEYAEVEELIDLVADRLEELGGDV